MSAELRPESVIWTISCKWYSWQTIDLLRIKFEMRFNGSNLKALKLQYETFYRCQESIRNDITVTDSSGRALLSAAIWHPTTPPPPASPPFIRHTTDPWQCELKDSFKLKTVNTRALARSGAPWVTKFGKLSIRENLVMTSPYVRPYVLTYWLSG